MKKLIICLMTLALALGLAACGGGESDEMTTLDTAAISSAISGGGLFIDSLEPLDGARIADVVGLDLTDCVSSEYHLGAGATGEEWGVFECKTVEGAKALKTQLEKHRDDLKETYASYAPDAVPRIENAVVARKGQYVVFITADKYDDAKALVDKLLA